MIRIIRRCGLLNKEVCTKGKYGLHECRLVRLHKGQCYCRCGKRFESKIEDRFNRGNHD